MKAPSLTAIFCIFGFAAAHSKMISAQPRLLDFTISEGKVNYLADFNEPFRWQNTRYDSVQTFPSFLPWLPEIPNTLRIGGSGTADYHLGDIMFAGTLHDLESNTMEIGLMGWLLPLQGIFNPERGLLKFDDLDFIPFSQRRDVSSNSPPIDSLGTCLWPRGFAQRISMARTHDGFLDPSWQRIGFLQDPDDSLINAI